MRAALAAGLLAVLALTGCASLDQGTVTAKEYDEAYTELIDGGNNTLIPIVYDECWHLYFTDGDRDGETCLPQEDWDAYQVGDHYPKPGH